MGRAGGVGTVVDTHTQVEGLQGGTRDVVDLALEERTEGVVHGEPARVAVGEIHSRGEHRDGDLAALLGRHRGEF